jgi:hypothetical protein
MKLEDIIKGFLNLPEREQEIFMEKINVIKNIYSLSFEKGTPYFNIDFILDKYLGLDDQDTNKNNN